MNKQGRPVDISGINIKELERWMEKNKKCRTFLKCQSIIALNNGSSMQEVCNVLNVTRESVRLWKEQLRVQGIKGLTKIGKVGKRSKLDKTKLKDMKEAVAKSPGKFRLDGYRWTGKLTKVYIKKKWNIEISLRTAHVWLKKAKQ